MKTIRKLFSLAIKLGMVVLVIYAARHVDYRRLLRAAEPSAPGAIQVDPGPCIDINSASRSQLERIVHIGGDRSRQIMELRLVKPFGSLDGLQRVSGIGPGYVQDMRRQGLACVR